MKKSWVILILAAVLIGFGLLVYLGFRRARGVPVAVREKQRLQLEVPLVDREIDLSRGIDLAYWKTREQLTIELLYQVMVIPWPKKVVPFVIVKSFHNGRDIYFYMEWQDDTEDNILDINKFSDAGAVMFSLEADPPASTLLMGFMGTANIWQWKASQDRAYWLGEIYKPDSYADFYYPFEEEELFVVSKESFESAANDLVAIRVATVTRKPKQNVAGRGFYDSGTWRIVFKRSLAAEDSEVDAQFTGKTACAFAVWNGAKGDRGGRKSISDWVELKLQ